MTNLNNKNSHERLVKRDIQTTPLHRIFFIAFFSFIIFNILKNENSNFYFFAYLLGLFIFFNILFLITKNKLIEMVSDIPSKLLSKIFDIIGTFFLAVFYFLIFTPFSKVKQISKYYSFSDSNWKDVESSKVDFENGF